ncbi:unnamed protein product [Soboliphyme baturini]|uniref:Multifunctional methyltransferase subunit TRM112-like protein n=1 Tax=Soboliphyme baturini TaxID=241478 RepID=A0A183IB17_9BILA|nr:unnamed protein product [Soboliphyme baturini]
MKLLVHNFLASKFLKGVTTGFPLKLVATKLEFKEREVNPDFIKKMVPRLDWSALKFAAACIQANNLPDILPADWEKDEALLKHLHHLLVEAEVEEGYLECPETGRQFPIKDGIPNMLANEDEVA